MNFAELARGLSRVEALDGDHEKVEEVAGLLEAAGDDLPVVSRFVQGRVFPVWDSRKLDVGPALLYEALSLASGEPVERIEELVKLEGDPGDAAARLEFEAQQTLGGGPESVGEVYAAFERLSSDSGEGGQKTKVRGVADLLLGADEESARYVTRLVLGEMRVGVGEGTVRDAVARAFEVDVELVERGFMLTNDVGEVAGVSRDEGEVGLRELDMRVGRPVKPMLARAGELSSALDDVGRPAAVEWKYDGARVQVHVDEAGDARLYSRNLEDLTRSLPEVVERVEAEVEADVVLDGEVVATGEDGPLAFQELLRRLRRKHGVDEARGEVSVDVYAFDCIYRGGALIDSGLEERYEELLDAAGELAAERWSVEDVEELREVEARALDAGHEGVVVKAGGSSYSPGRRGGNWLKLKPEPETLDLVVTGGEWGEGRRADFVGSYELSVRSDGELLPVGHVATGLTDERLEELTERFEPLVVSEEGREIEFEPRVVFEVGYEEVQESPKYESGYALRFPRFVRVRDEMDVGDADSLERVGRLAP